MIGFQRKYKFAFIKKSLDELVTDLEQWQQRFDPTWYLITLNNGVLDKIPSPLSAALDPQPPILQRMRALRQEHFSTFLTTVVYTDQPPHTDQTGTSPSDRDGPTNWAAAARSGISHPQPPTIQPKSSTTTTLAEDLRILVRIPEEHQDWAKSLTNFALREATCKTLDLSLADIQTLCDLNKSRRPGALTRRPATAASGHRYPSPRWRRPPRALSRRLATAAFCARNPLASLSSYDCFFL